MTALFDDLAEFLKRARVDLSSESSMQIELARLLGGQFSVRPEFRLSARDRIDFLVQRGQERVGIECKIKGPAMGVFRQVERYTESDQVDGVILFSSFFMELPPAVNGKPLRVVHAGASWL